MADRQLRIMWVNDRASFYGGCERYVGATASLMAELGHEGSLRYNDAHPTDQAFLDLFNEAQGSGDIVEQMDRDAPDLVYLHKVDNHQHVKQVLDAARCPVVMFIHDHDHFCLRYHKITTLGKKVCRRPASAWNCYRCLGFINRAHEWPGVRFRGMKTLRSLQTMIRRCDHLVVGSNYMRDHVIAHGFAPEQVNRMALYADIPSPPTPFEGEKTNEFLFVGNFLPGKGIDLLLEAFAKAEVSNPLRIIGSIGEATVYKDQAKQLGIADRVVFQQGLERTDVLRVMRESLAVVVPSRNPETFGLVAVESISQSTPVIASDAGATAEWIEDDVNGYQFPSDDAASLAHCLEKMAASPDKAKRLGQEGFRLYQESFTPQRHLEQLESLFRKAIEGAPKDPSNKELTHA